MYSHLHIMFENILILESAKVIVDYLFIIDGEQKLSTQTVLSLDAIS